MSDPIIRPTDKRVDPPRLLSSVSQDKEGKDLSLMESAACTYLGWTDLPKGRYLGVNLGSPHIRHLPKGRGQAGRNPSVYLP